MRFFTHLISSAIILGMIGLLAILFLLDYFSRDLPSYAHIAHYKPSIVTRIYTSEGNLIEEYAKERRLYIPIDEIPPLVKGAFLSAEDKHFYQHPGIDIMGIVRAALTNLKNIGRGRRPVGASTITQQVAKNFLLTNEVSYTRKIKEAILALRLEQAYTKDHILELYLNEFYLGNRSYGVASAALNYFNKSLDDLTIEEAAFLAALPKAPSRYNPKRNYEAAFHRRNWVIDRMVEDQRISAKDGERAKATPIITRNYRDNQTISAPYFSEEIRKKMIQIYGSDKFYQDGLSIKTSLDPHLQKIAHQSLQKGLLAYDKRHGWRGPIAHIKNEDLENWKNTLQEIKKKYPYLPKNWQLALVYGKEKNELKLAFLDETTGLLTPQAIKWTKKTIDEIAKIGDVILVQKQKKDGYKLQQIPEIEGAIIAMDPHTGRILAMDGGFDFRKSPFNRATQAKRQTGSAFKPFVYLSALSNGFTPSSIILDAPITLAQGYGLGKWKPSNVTNQYYGPTPLRRGLERSRNIMTIRLAQKLGMDKITPIAEKFGIMDRMPPHLSMAIGAGESTLLKMTTAYAMLVNGGKKITPSYIDRVQDRNGKTLFKNDHRPCPACSNIDWKEGLLPPEITEVSEPIHDPRILYQVVSLMEGVIKRGSGWRVRNIIKHPIAGKTGTTNDAKDAWFIGFTPDLVVGVFVGFDVPKSMGEHEGGSRTASPIFASFMKEALKNKPKIPFRIPSGLRFVKTDPTTGLPASPQAKNAILEAFIPGTEPKAKPAPKKEGQNPSSPSTQQSSDQSDADANTGLGGLY